MSDEKCPQCGFETDRDSVDVGVGTIYGPRYCNECGWSADRNAGKVIDGWYTAPDGHRYRVEGLVNRAARFGPAVADACREAFKE